MHITSLSAWCEAPPQLLLFLSTQGNLTSITSPAPWVIKLDSCDRATVSAFFEIKTFNRTRQQKMLCLKWCQSQRWMSFKVNHSIRSKGTGLFWLTTASLLKALKGKSNSFFLFFIFIKTKIQKHPTTVWRSNPQKWNHYQNPRKEVNC